MDVEIAAAFASSTILRPSANEPDLVHLTRALASLSGVRKFDPPSAPMAELEAAIGAHDHLVFVLLDGLGMNLLRRMPANSLMVRALKRTIRATCPSTTACALTSIATGTWPSQHAVTGWFTHLPERGLTATTLPMIERFQGRPLSELGVGIDDVLPVGAFHRELTRRVLTLLPTPIFDTVYARYSRGGTAGSPYSSLADAAQQVVTFVGASAAPSYTHLYVPDVDTVCHHDGLTAPAVLELLLGIDAELARLRERLPENARLVISADHGLLDVPESGHLPLPADDRLCELLEVPPSGDARLPIFHVRAGCQAEFVERFSIRYGSALRLMKSSEAEEIGLFGPPPTSEAARRRFGDFVGIALRPVTLHYARPLPPDAPPPHAVYRAQHAGLTRDEMEIPFIVA